MNASATATAMRNDVPPSSVRIKPRFAAKNIESAIMTIIRMSRIALIFYYTSLLGRSQYRRREIVFIIYQSDVFIKHYDDVDVVKIGDFGLVKIPESNLTSLLSELKGSLNDPDLINVGFGNYEMRHETFALTRLCYYILTGKTNIDRQKDGTIKAFWEKGTNPDKSKRFSSVDELKRAIKSITDDNK